MYNDGYNPEALVYSYRRLGHGKARVDAIRSAVSQADLNNDIPYMIFWMYVQVFTRFQWRIV